MKTNILILICLISVSFNLFSQQQVVEYDLKLSNDFNIVGAIGVQQDYQLLKDRKRNSLDPQDTVFLLMNVSNNKAYSLNYYIKKIKMVISCKDINYEIEEDLKKPILGDELSDAHSININTSFPDYIIKKLDFREPVHLYLTFTWYTKTEISGLNKRLDHYPKELFQESSQYTYEELVYQKHGPVILYDTTVDNFYDGLRTFKYTNLGMSWTKAKDKGVTVIATAPVLYYISNRWINDFRGEVAIVPTLTDISEGWGYGLCYKGIIHIGALKTRKDFESDKRKLWYLYLGISTSDTSFLK